MTFGKLNQRLGVVVESLSFVDHNNRMYHDDGEPRERGEIERNGSIK